MTPEQLRAAAERIAIRSAMPGDIDVCAQHILATVHADDDEPVTVAKFLQLGAEEKKTPSGSRYLRLTGMIAMWPGYQDCWYINGAPVCDFNPTIGQLRHLLAGLGMGGGE